MKLSQFQFPISLKKDIAHEPTGKWRDESRMMVLHKDTGEIEHKIFKNIVDYFGKGDPRIRRVRQVRASVLGPELLKL